MAKKTIHDFSMMKQRGEKIAWISAYDYPTARCAEAAGLDMILVGDSLGVCVYGYEDTTRVTMEQCIAHSDAVRRGAPNTFVVGDMPEVACGSPVDHALASARRLVHEAGVDAVKLAGGQRVLPLIQGILDAGITVVGQVGFTRQSGGRLADYTAKWGTATAALTLLDDALALEQAGVQMLLLVAVPVEVGRCVSERLSIPVLSIGAGMYCDGQVLVVNDLIGQGQPFLPEFAKGYCSVAEIVTNAMKQYCADVRSGAFPGEEQCYHMAAGECAKLDEAFTAKKEAQKLANLGGAEPRFTLIRRRRPGNAG